jgi:hypothetical protein
MEIENIIGGVSPLKARQATRGGEYAGKATSTSRRRGGFAASEGVRGGGGRNVGGYNVRTKFVTAPAWVKPTSTGFTPTQPTISEKIIGGDPKGWKEYVPGTEGTPDREEKRESKGTFKEVWAANEGNFQDKWKDKGGYEAWKTQAQKEIDTGYYDSKFIKGTAGKPGYWLHYNAKGEVVKREEGGPDLYTIKAK